MSSPLFRFLLAATFCLTPLGWAAAQDQQQQRDDQQRREQQEQKQKQQPPQQQQRVQPQGNPAPQGKGTPGNGQQFQRPAQNNAAPPSPPPGRTASPTPPSGQNQFQRVQGPPQNLGAPPTGPAQQQQFEQRSVQRGAPAGAPPPQGQQQTTISRGNPRGGTAAFAQRHAGAAPTQFSGGRFYGRDYAHFTPRELGLWRGGAWRRESHDGRFGWWFVVDGIWYLYDQPIYPYPTFVPDVVYMPEEDYGYDDDGSADPAASLPNGVFYANGVYYYYYCPSLQAYYPYVGTCPSPWQTVPATPQ